MQHKINEMLGRAMAGLRSFWADQRGATVIEYVLILSLIAGAVISAFTDLADASGALLGFVSSTLTG